MLVFVAELNYLIYLLHHAFFTTLYVESFGIAMDFFYSFFNHFFLYCLFYNSNYIEQEGSAILSPN